MYKVGSTLNSGQGSWSYLDWFTTSKAEPAGFLRSCDGFRMLLVYFMLRLLTNVTAAVSECSCRNLLIKTLE